MKVKEEDIDRLSEIRDEMLDLVEEAKGIMSSIEDIVGDRAKSYWIPQLIMGLTTNHNYLGGSMCTMEDTIEELKELLEEEYEEEEDYDE